MDTKIISKIEEILKIFKERDDYELEFKYDAKITKDKFNKVVEYYKKQKLNVEEKTTLDIIFENKKTNYRITIDEDQITKYSTTNKITKEMIKEFLVKQKISDYKPLKIPSYNLKLNLKEERQVEDEDLKKSLLSILSRSLKGYRHKKRISFIAKNYRVDLTIVRDYNNANPKSFVSNKTFSVNDILKEENYEIEIEVIKNDKITALEFSRIGVKIYEIINEEDKEDRPDIKEEEAETTMSWMLPNRIGYGEKIFKNFPPENYQQKKEIIWQITLLNKLKFCMEKR